MTISMPAMLQRKPKPSEQQRIDAAVAIRHRHPLALIDVTLGEMASIARNGYALSPEAYAARLTQIREALLKGATSNG